MVSGKEQIGDKELVEDCGQKELEISIVK